MEINNTEKSITLKDIFEMFKRRIWWFIGIFVGGCVLTIVFVMLMVKPQYKSTSSVLVNPEKFQSASNNNDVSGGLRATQTIASWMTEEIIIEETINNLVSKGVIKQNQYTVSKFSSMISTKTVTTNLFVYISITSTNKDFAKTALDELVTTGLKKSVEKDSNDVYKYPVAADSYSLVTPARDANPTGAGKKLYAVVGAAVSLVISCAVVICIEVFKNKFSTVDELTHSLGLPVLGITLDDPENINKEPLDSDKFINKVNYEKLLTNIDFSLVGNDKKVIEFTSTDAAEGKSTTAMNLARTLSGNNRKVLVIDLDLRKPTIHKHFGLERNNGVSEYVTSDKEVNINQVDENIAVITAGSKVPNPSIIIQSERLKDLIESNRDKYDYILLDCPPVMAASDAKLITKLSDAVVFVVAVNRTKASFVKKCLTEINVTESNVIGLNATNVKGTKTNYYYYRNYYSEDKKN